MSRAWQAERQADREEAQLFKDYEAGVISRAEYNEALRELQRDVRAAYEEDQWEAAQAVRQDWGL